MSQEIEFKFGVADEAALDRFAAAFGLSRANEPSRTQQNSFFDTREGDLRAQGLALRLRVENGRGILTIKGKGTPRSAHGALHSRFEAELEIEHQDARAILDGQRSPLDLLAGSSAPDVKEGLERVRTALGPAKLVHLGGFENERTTLPPVAIDVSGRTETLVFELDRTSFPGNRVDCEIEAEIGPEVAAEPLFECLRGIFEQAGIPWKPAPSKLARFREIQKIQRDAL